MGLSDDLTYSQQLASENRFNSNALDDLNNQLSSVYSSLTDLNALQTNALSRQNDIKNIIDTEAGRLQSKQLQIDQAAENQKRLIYFNDNSRKIYAAYLKIIVTAVITLAIVWVIRVINFHFGEFIPVIIINILLVVTITTGLIIIYNYYVAIKSRDPYNFDELNLSPPAPLATPSPSPLPGSSSISGGGNICQGSNCCSSPSTIWDAANNKCIVPTGTSSPTSKVAFTLMYSPNEAVESYAPITK